MSFLNDTEKELFIRAVAEIKDKIKAIDNELWSREKPCKGYLLEKLNNINWNVQMLLANCKEETEIQVNNDCKEVLCNAVDDIHQHCVDGHTWLVYVFLREDWENFDRIYHSIVEKDYITEKELNELVDLENELCEKENQGLEPISEECHKELIDIMNVLCDKSLLNK